MKDSGVEWIGKIPFDRTIIRTKYSIIYEKGKIPNSTNEQGEGIPYIGASDLDDISGNCCYSVYTQDNFSTCDYNDTLILWDGARAGLVGTHHRGGISSTIVNLHPDTKKIDKKFWYWYIKGFEWYFIQNVNGTTIPHMNKKYINDICFINFLHNEQTKRADYLQIKCTKIDTIIAKQQEVIEKLKEYKLSVITEAVTKGLNPDVTMKDSEVEWIGFIPAHWDIKRLRYIGSCQNGISKGRDFFGTGYPFVSYTDVYKNMELPYKVNGLIESTRAEQKNYSVIEGDIFFTRTSETIEEIGLTSVCNKTIENATFAGFLIRVRPKHGMLYTLFAKYYFRSEKHRQFFVKEMNLVIRASLGQELLKRLPVILPPINEQKEIAKYLEHKCELIDKVILKKERIIDRLISYKKSLIYEVVTGKKEV